MPQALLIEGLTVVLRGRRVLDDLHLSIAQGEMVGLVGESGSGKTLTAAATLGLLPARAKIVAGTIHTCGVDVLRDGQAAEPRMLREIRKDKTALILQDPMTALNPTRRVGAQLLDLMCDTRTRSSSRAAALRWFDAMRLPDPERVFNAYPFQLSGGQRQRVLIAMGLCRSPQLVLADEITTALDVSLRVEILALLAERARYSDAGVLLISHDLGAIRQVCSRVYIMLQGRIVEHGTVADTLEHPREPYTQHLLAAQPERSAPRTRLPVNAA